MRKLLFILIPLIAFGEEPFLESSLIYEPTDETPDHVHASCVVECPNGDLIAVWYENGKQLPPPHFSDAGDKSDDVRIGGAYLAQGNSEWSAPFVMFDTFGASDNNPCLVVDADERLWLVHATLIGVPENSWGSALVNYRIAVDYMRPGAPDWSIEQILVPRPIGLEDAIKGAMPERAQTRDGIDEIIAKRLTDPLKVRLGWMPRVHPFVRSDGAVLIPLANENYGIVAMAITEDGGQTWSMSNAVPLAGLEQPSVAEAPDGRLVAFFRSADDEPRVRRSESTDGGVTWSTPELTELVHPFSGLEIVYLRNGHLLLIYNDKEQSPRDRLAVIISDDDGETWKWKRHLEDTPGGRFDYPSIIQSKDGTLHATYSYNLKTVKHVHFNEAWVQAGE